MPAYYKRVFVEQPSAIALLQSLVNEGFVTPLRHAALPTSPGTPTSACDTTAATMTNVAWVAIVALCVTSSVVGCSAGASAVPPFNEQRWGQALRQIGDMVGIDWRSQRLVCPIGDCIAAHTWPSEVCHRCSRL